MWILKSGEKAQQGWPADLDDSARSSLFEVYIIRQTEEKFILRYSSLEPLQKIFYSWNKMMTLGTLSTDGITWEMQLHQFCAMYNTEFCLEI